MIRKKIFSVTKFTLALICMSIVILCVSNDALASTSTSRLAGNDRYQTAIAVSQEGWSSGAGAVVLTTGENYPDALSAASLAGKYDAPILLASSKGLSNETLAEIKRLNPKRVYIVGGVGVIPGNVGTQLSASGISVQRLSGENRYDTALEVAKAVGLSKGIFIVSGESFADALSVAPIAAAEGMAIIPVPSSDLTDSYKKYFARARLNRTIIVGDKKQIPEKIRSQFPSAEIIEGEDPYSRNISLIEYFESGLNNDTICITTGQNYPDALAAAAYAKKNKHPLVLVQGNNIPASAQNYFAKRIVSKVQVFGGEGTVSSSTISRLEDYVPSVVKVDDINVTVVENQSYELPLKVWGKTSSGNVAEVPVKWNLTNVSTSKAGTYYYLGSVEGYEEPVQLTLTVEAAPIKVDTFTAEIIRGSSYTLPEKVAVTMSDLTTQEIEVIWSTTPNVAMLNKAGNYTFQGAIEGTDLKTSVNLKVSEDRAVNFEDDSFRWAVKFTLGKPSSTQPVYLSEVLQITTLNLKGYGIRDLTGLEAFTNLVSIDLSNNFLESSALSRIQNLKNLEHLNLRNNKIEQISALSGLNKLTELDLSFNKIKDFLPIRDLTRLTSLYLSVNESQDYSPVRLYYHQLKSKDFSL
ncbi:putative cell wall-binding domain [Desulfitobacterium sp. LBE]|uniref:cell wall-binding repeat-containing protein n=1 Tax=Desulfitobacterium sp. LBE TaxID=884086 RepID=UPI001198CC6D|nr:cell wall-binding repeat-containing protein [Desulfitobacterium sp. LBE]TWH59712.1 putative cell wall-binding domain [Desulfitobacterium sp. LBE]